MENIMGMLGQNPKNQHVDEKLVKAKKEKDDGNEHFKKGDLAKAIYYYHRALLCVNGLVGKELEKERNDMIVQCSNNLAACLLKQEKYEKVVTYCDKVLKIEPRNEKALFRRGKSHMMLNDVERAEADLKKALELNPEDKVIQRELAILQKKSKQQDKKQQKFYANMFEKLSKDEEELAPPKPKPVEPYTWGTQPKDDDDEKETKTETKKKKDDDDEDEEDEEEEENESKTKEVSPNEKSKVEEMKD